MQQQQHDCACHSSFSLLCLDAFSKANITVATAWIDGWTWNQLSNNNIASQTDKLSLWCYVLSSADVRRQPEGCLWHESESVMRQGWAAAAIARQWDKRDKRLGISDYHRKKENQKLNEEIQQDCVCVCVSQKRNWGKNDLTAGGKQANNRHWSTHTHTHMHVRRRRRK